MSNLQQTDELEDLMGLPLIDDKYEEESEDSEQEDDLITLRTQVSELTDMVKAIAGHLGNSANKESDAPADEDAVKAFTNEVVGKVVSQLKTTQRHEEAKQNYQEIVKSGGKEAEEAILGMIEGMTTEQSDVLLTNPNVLKLIRGQVVKESKQNVRSRYYDDAPREEPRRGDDDEARQIAALARHMGLTVPDKKGRR